MKPILLVTLISILLTSGVIAQPKPATKRTRTAEAERVWVAARMAELPRLHDEYIKAISEYQDSLRKLLALYKESLRKADERLLQSRELNEQGSILTAREQAVEDAKSKVNTTEQQIVDAESAKQKPFKLPSAAELTRDYRQASAHQPSCRNWTLTTSRRERGSTIVISTKLVCQR